MFEILMEILRCQDMSDFARLDEEIDPDLRSSSEMEEIEYYLFVHGIRKGLSINFLEGLGLWPSERFTKSLILAIKLDNVEFFDKIINHFDVIDIMYNASYIGKYNSTKILTYILESKKELIESSHQHIKNFSPEMEILLSSYGLATSGGKEEFTESSVNLGREGIQVFPCYVSSNKGVFSFSVPQILDILAHEDEVDPSILRAILLDDVIGVIIQYLSPEKLANLLFKFPKKWCKFERLWEGLTQEHFNFLFTRLSHMSETEADKLKLCVLECLIENGRSDLMLNYR